VNALDGFASLFRRVKRKVHVNSPDYQYSLVIFDLAAGVCGEASIACIDLARFQRAPEGS